MDGEKYSSFNGPSLSTSDRDILKGPCYINDQIIEFYLRFLAHAYNDEEILLVPPAVSYLLANCTDPEDLRETVEPLKIHLKKLVFFTVNQESAHWSLLVYCRTMNVFVHHDSVKGLNYSHAKKLYNVVKDFVGNDSKPMGLMPLLRPESVRMKKGKNVRRKSKGSRGVDKALFVESFTPQQTNGYDCGLYVMKIAAVICQWYSSKKGNEDKSLWYDEVKSHVIGSYVENIMRADILELMDMIKEECW